MASGGRSVSAPAALTLAVLISSSVTSGVRLPWPARALRRVLGLGIRAPRDRLRMVLRDPRLPDRPGVLRAGAPRAIHAHGRL